MTEPLTPETLAELRLNAERCASDPDFPHDGLGRLVRALPAVLDAAAERLAEVEAERDALAAKVERVRAKVPDLIPLGDLHAYRCRCHGDGDPIGNHHGRGVFDDNWYAPECITQAKGAHRAKNKRVAAALAALDGTSAHCNRGPCHLPRGHGGPCNPGGDALDATEADHA